MDYRAAMNANFANAVRQLDQRREKFLAEINQQRIDNLKNLYGFDYDNQAWVKAGRYVRCGHPETMKCGCYGREHAGELVSLETAANIR